jgi:hypothetical protein
MWTVWKVRGSRPWRVVNKGSGSAGGGEIASSKGFALRGQCFKEYVRNADRAWFDEFESR